MKPEKAGNDFIEHLPYIETVIFSAGGYFEGFERTTVHFSDSQAVFDAETMNPPSAMAPAHAGVLFIFYLPVLPAHSG